ncbi:MAG: polymer-forming cytoskeletal family protein [Spirochaetaceae bacterium]|nr:MAG: polymer-forming cytoskeletal family protein [Spirochaetaceae bacterium]
MARSTQNKVPKTSTRLGVSTQLSGKLRFKDSLRVSGSFEGEIDSEGFLYVDAGAVVKADIRARSVVLGGTVRGNVHASERVELLPSARMYGNVRAARVRIGEGVVFEGQCEMIRNASTVDVFAVPANQLRKSVQDIYESEL